METGVFARLFPLWESKPTLILSDPEAAKSFFRLYDDPTVLVLFAHCAEVMKLVQEDPTWSSNSRGEALVSPSESLQRFIHFVGPPSRRRDLRDIAGHFALASSGVLSGSTSSMYFTGPRGAGKSKLLLTFSIAAALVASLRGRLVHSVIVRAPPYMDTPCLAELAKREAQGRVPEYGADGFIHRPDSIVWRALQHLGYTEAIDSSHNTLLMAMEGGLKPPKEISLTGWQGWLCGDKANLLMCFDEVQEYFRNLDEMVMFRAFVMRTNEDATDVKLVLTGSSSYLPLLLRASVDDVKLLRQGPYKEVTRYLREMNSTKVRNKGKIGLLRTDECFDFLKSARSQLTPKGAAFVSELEGLDSDVVADLMETLHYVTNGLPRNLLRERLFDHFDIVDGVPVVTDRDGLLSATLWSELRPAGSDRLSMLLDAAAFYVLAHQRKVSTARPETHTLGGFVFPRDDPVPLQVVVNTAKSEAARWKGTPMESRIGAIVDDLSDRDGLLRWEDELLRASELGLIPTPPRRISFEHKRWIVEAVEFWLERSGMLAPTECAALMDPSSHLYTSDFERLMTAEVLTAGLANVARAVEGEGGAAMRALEGLPGDVNLLGHRGSLPSEPGAMPALRLWGGSNAKRGNRGVAEPLREQGLRSGVIYKELNDWGKADSLTVLPSEDTSTVFVVRLQCKGSVSERAYPLGKAWLEVEEMEDAMLSSCAVMRKTEPPETRWKALEGEACVPLREVLRQVEDERVKSASKVVLVNVFLTVAAFQESSEARHRRRARVEAKADGVTSVSLMVDRETMRGLWSEGLTKAAESIGITRYSAVPGSPSAA